MEVQVTKVCLVILLALAPGAALAADQVPYDPALAAQREAQFDMQDCMRSVAHVQLAMGNRDKENIGSRMIAACGPKYAATLRMLNIRMSEDQLAAYLTASARAELAFVASEGQ